MRILFSFVGGWGHAEPLMPLARAAVAAGHDVAFSAQQGMLRQVAAAGFTCWPSGPPTLRTDRSPLIVPDREAERAAVRDVFAGFVAAGRAGDLDRIVRSWRPDVIVCDEVDFGAMVIAEVHAVPHVSVVVIASGTFVVGAFVAGALDELRATWRLTPDPTAQMLSRHLVLAPGPPSFRDPAAPLASTGVWMRPAVHVSPDTPRPGGRQLVYVTLGTIFNLESGDLFARVLTGVHDVDVDVLVTVGPYIDPAEFGPQPANVRIESFVPQAEVLPRCSAVVCHGGSGTVIGALSCGVPLVVLAMGADQIDNAARCEALGVGLSLDVIGARPEDICQAVNGVLADDHYRIAAAALQTEVASLPDASFAVDLIERLSS